MQLRVETGEGAGRLRRWIGAPGFDPAASTGQRVTVGIVVAIAYFATAVLSLLLARTPEYVAIIWPASGIAVGALVLVGRGGTALVAAAVAGATCAANLVDGAPPAAALVFAAVNVVECLVVARLFARMAGAPPDLNALPKVLAFFAAAAIGTAPAALVAALVIHSLGLSAAPLVDIWSLWCRADFIGIIAVAPLLVGLGTLRRMPPTRAELFEASALIVILVAAAVYILSIPPVGGPWPGVVSNGLVFPFILALAVRSRPPFAALGSMLMAFVIVTMTVLGVGRFGDAALGLDHRILAGQIAISIAVLCTLTISALFSGGRETAAALRRSEQKLQLSLEAARLGNWEFDIGTGSVSGSHITHGVFGSAPTPRRSLADVLSVVYRADRERFERTLRRAIDETGEFDIECRLFMPDRSVRWAHLAGRVHRDSAGAPALMLGVSHDITARKEAERALRQSEEWQRLALEAAALGAWRADLASGTVTLDPRAAHHLGLGAKTTWSAIDAVADPDDRGRVAAFRAALEASPAAAPPCCVEFRIGSGPRPGRWIRLHAMVDAETHPEPGAPAPAVGTTQDITEGKRAEERQRLLVRELDHRVKNILAVIEVVVERSRVGDKSTDDVLEAIRARLRSMARTHERLSRARWSGVALETIVADELEPYRGAGAIDVGGPHVVLTPEAAQAITMTVHELTTNAVKHGALSAATGRVEVRWRLDGAASDATQRLLVTWRESGGPAVPAGSPAEGYGTGIIRDLVRHELKGRARLEFRPEGVVYELEVPLARTMSAAAEAASSAAATDGASAPPVETGA